MKKKEEIKLIILGDTGVGKTSIINRYIENKFTDNIPSTIGSNYIGKNLKRGDKQYVLNIWDTTGQEKYRSVTKLFVQDAKIVVLVYSINSKESFKVLDIWYKQVLDICGENIIIAVVGNKTDLFDQNEYEDNELVSEEEGKKYATDKNALFKLVSAKIDRKGINSLFDELLDEYIKKNPNSNSQLNSFQLNPPSNKKMKKKENCC